MTRVALVHDWLTGMRGGEAVLEAIVELFPNAELFTLIAFPEKISPRLASLPTHTSWLQKIPQAEKKYRHFLPLMPGMIERFDLKGFDLIVSSSHCVAKGVQKGPESVHVSYVHAPMRYIWDRYDDYFGLGQASMPVRFAAQMVRSSLQRWDRKVSTPGRINQIVANSAFIASQIKSAYYRDSLVVHPFADLSRFQGVRRPSSFYLIVSAFAPYKRIDLAIQAFNELKLPLKIVGSGQNEKQLRALAGPTVELLGSCTNDEVARLYSQCRALVFPGVEDFGITPVEAMASGAPVIAFQKGGALETITPSTGLFFDGQTEKDLVTALQEAVLKLEKNPSQISEAECRNRAAHFSKERFKDQFAAVIRKSWVAAGKTSDSSPI